MSAMSDAPETDPNVERTTAHRPSRGTTAFWLAIVLAVITFVASSAAREYDRGIANLIIAIGGLLTLITLAIWLWRTAWWPRWVKLTVVAIGLLAMIGFFSLYRFDGFQGAMRPHFQWRWSPPPTSVSQSLPADAPPPVADDRQFTSDFYSSRQFFYDGQGTFADRQLPNEWPQPPLPRLWQIELGDGWSSFAVADGIAVTLEEVNGADHENLLAIRLDNGQPLWRVALPGTHSTLPGGAGPRSTPAIADGIVYAAGSTGSVVAARLQTGEVLWREDLLTLSGDSQSDFESRVSWGRSGSPLVVDEYVVFPLGGVNSPHTLVAFDTQNGQVQWRSGDEQITYSSPVVMTLLGRRQIVYLSEATAAGYDIGTGERIWEHPWTGDSNSDATVSQVVQISDSDILLSKGYLRGASRIHLVREEDAWRTEAVWSSAKSLKTKLTSAVIRDGFAYGLNEGKLECVDLADGRRRWVRGRYGDGQVLLVGEQLIVTSEAGELIAVAAVPNQAETLYSEQILGDAVAWNVPALAGDLLLMRNADEAACIRLPVSRSEQ